MTDLERLLAHYTAMAKDTEGGSDHHLWVGLRDELDAYLTREETTETAGMDSLLDL